ncbi:MAG: zinc ribbon domain-containing protein [Prevotella sp.]|nr:zinc ribbon domain-containing protein [Prevotella sp.]
MIMKCPECGHQVSDLADTCPSCGIAIAGNITKCPHCGGTMLANQTVCPNCLESVSSKTPRRQQNIEDTVTEQPQPEQSQPEQPEAPKKKNHKSLWATLIVALVIALGVTFVGYYFYQHTQRQNEQYAYENAIQSSEPAVLQNFLDIYTDAPQAHRDSVAAHLEVLKQIDLEWTNALATRSKSAMLKYIQLHPNSIHVTEAKLVVDSLDWIQAANTNTLESYKTYMETHSDGLHYDDAKMNYDKLNERVVTPEEEQMISQLFNSYFNSLAKDDENSLLATLGTVMHTFFNRQNVTKSDVVQYMKKLHEAADITGMNFLLNNDWKIDKIENIDTGELEYAVTFSVDQRIDRTDPDQERLATYKVSAKVSPEGKIVDLNMKKVAK